MSRSTVSAEHPDAAAHRRSAENIAHAFEALCATQRSHRRLAVAVCIAITALSLLAANPRLITWLACS